MSRLALSKHIPDDLITEIYHKLLPAETKLKYYIFQQMLNNYNNTTNT